MRIKESSEWLGNDLLKILQDPVQTNIKNQLDVALQPFATTVLAIHDKTMKLAPVSTEGQEAHDSCLCLADTFYNEYMANTADQSIEISVGQGGGDARTAKLSLSEACLAPYFASLSLVAEDFLEDGKDFETGDLLEAAAAIIAATRSLESRGASLPEKASAYAKEVAETARVKLQSQLGKAGMAMASNFKQFTSDLKASLGELQECRQCFADLKDPAHVRSSAAQLLELCNSKAGHRKTWLE